MKIKRGDVIRPGHVEHFVGADEGPAQAGPRQLSGDTPVPPHRIHQNTAEVAAGRGARTRLIRRQLKDPAIGDYVAVGLGDKHLAQIIGNVRCELLTAVTRLHSKDTYGKLDRGCNGNRRERLDLHRARHAIGWRRPLASRIVPRRLADYPMQPQCTVYGSWRAAPTPPLVPAEAGISHSFLTDWADDTGLLHPGRTPGGMLTCGYEFWRTGENVRVGVHGHAGLGTPKQRHDGPGRDALGEQEGGTSVPHVI